MPIRVLVLSALFAGGAATSSALSAPARIALVIGNGDYAVAQPLDNPPSDARKLAAELKDLGFEVDLETNLDHQHLADAVHEFGARLKTSGPNVVSFFYYAGHAAQDMLRINYLLPVDATARGPEEVRRQAIPVQGILDDMQAADNDVNILVIDACRDWFKTDRRPTIPRGLHDMGRHGNVLIALATSPDTTDEEGAGDRSPYTARLLTALTAQAGDPVALLFDDVDHRVYSDTDKAQAPEYVNGLAKAPRWSLKGPPVDVFAVAPALKFTRIPPYLMGLNRERLLAFTHGNTTFVDTLFTRRDLLAQNGIDTPQRLAYFLAEMALWNANFRNSAPTFNYSAAELMKLKPKKFPTMESAQAYVGQPDRIANVLYADMAGNGDEASGDGWRYRARGYPPLVGKVAYKEWGVVIDADLVRTPDRASEPDTGLALAAAFWLQHGSNKWADEDGLTDMAKSASRLGLERYVEIRRLLLDKAKAAVAPDA